MRQAIHILEKDVRHLWIEIAVTLVSVGLFVFVHTHPAFWQSRTYMPQTVAEFLVRCLLPVSWWVLIVRAIHAETLTGDCEFWPTRPYSWKSLLAAKMMVILLFVNLPMLVAQSIILETHGFPFWAEMGSLLWNQVLLSGAFFLPVAAIGALTTGMAQFLLVGLAGFAAMTLLSFRFIPIAMLFAGGMWGGMEWIRSYYDWLLLGLFGSALLLWQYAQRRTPAARLAAAVAVVIVAAGWPLSWGAAWSIQSHFSRRAADGSSIRAGFNFAFHWMTRALVEGNQRVTVSIPLQLTGVADDQVARAEGVIAAITGAGAAWPPGGSVSSSGQLITFRTTLDEVFYQKVKGQPVSLRGTLYLTLYGNRRETKVALNRRLQPVPGLGLCTGANLSTVAVLSCNAALRPSAYRVRVDFGPATSYQDYRPARTASYSPFPAELSIYPLTAFETQSPPLKKPLDAVTVGSEEPVAFVRAPLAIDGLRLGAYEAKLKQ